MAQINQLQRNTGAMQSLQTLGGALGVASTIMDVTRQTKLLDGLGDRIARQDQMEQEQLTQQQLKTVGMQEEAAARPEKLAAVKKASELQQKKIGMEIQREADKAKKVAIKEARTQEDALRKEHLNHPTTKGTIERAQSMGSILSAKPTAAGDMSLIFAYMKMLDPGSTVREGEFANVENSRGVSDSVRNTYNKIITGERLTGNQRFEFKKQAASIYDTQLDQQKAVDEQILSIAKRREINPEGLLQRFSTGDELLSKAGFSSERPPEEEGFFSSIASAIAGDDKKKPQAGPMKFEEKSDSDLNNLFKALSGQ